MPCPELMYSSDTELKKYVRVFFWNPVLFLIFGFTPIFLQSSRDPYFVFIPVSFILCAVFGCLWAAIDKKPLISVIAAGVAALFVMPVAYTALFFVDWMSRGGYDAGQGAAILHILAILSVITMHRLGCFKNTKR